MFGTLMPTWFIITTPLLPLCATATWTANPTVNPATNSVTLRIEVSLRVVDVMRSRLRAQHTHLRDVAPPRQVRGNGRPVAAVAARDRVHRFRRTRRKNGGRRALHRRHVV